MKIVRNTLAAMAVAGSALVANAEGWDQSLNLGATVTKGNSESLLVTLGYSASKKEVNDEYTANLFYTYGESDSDTAGIVETTNDEILANAAWKHLYNDRLYAGPRFDFRMDSLADIDHRAQLTGVVGYYVIKEEDKTLGLEGGLGITSESIGGDDSEYVHAYFGESFEYKISKATRIYQSLGIFAPADDLGDYNLVAELGLETSLSDKLSLNVYIQDKYEANPAAGSENNDIKLVTGVSYKF